jgi:hypothetical protein
MDAATNRLIEIGLQKQINEIAGFLKSAEDVLLNAQIRRDNLYRCLQNLKSSSREMGFDLKEKVV